MKTVCIFHKIDLDGWMSAAIVKHWWNNMPQMKSVSDAIDFVGYNYGDKLPDLSSYDRVIMVDSSFTKDNMLFLANKFGTNFIWIDHHQRTINEVNKCLVDFSKNEIEGLVTEEGELKAACELTWQYFFPNENMPEIVRLLGRYDCFGHKGTAEEQMVLEFQYGARDHISDYEDAYSYLLKTERKDVGVAVLNEIWNNGKAIYSFLCTDAKQSYKNGFEIQFKNPGHKKHATQTMDMRDAEILSFICINKERFNPINFGIDYHSEGYDGAACFHYADGMWKFSLYNDNGLVDCSVIAKQYGGGGHKGASGFVVKDINQIFNQ